MLDGINAELESMMEGYDSLLDSLDGEDAEDIILSENMSTPVIEENLMSGVDLTEVYNDDQIEVIFGYIRSGAVNDCKMTIGVFTDVDAMDEDGLESCDYLERTTQAEFRYNSHNPDKNIKALDQLVHKIMNKLLPEDYVYNYIDDENVEEILEDFTGDKWGTHPFIVAQGCIKSEDPLDKENSDPHFIQARVLVSRDE